MMMAPAPACPHCGKPVKLDESLVRVPLFVRRWWQFGDERSEYRCKACQKFSVLGLSLLGGVLYGCEIAGIAAGWTLTNLPHTGLLAGGAALAALLYRHAIRLKPS